MLNVKKYTKVFLKKNKNLIDNFEKNLIIDVEDCFKTNTMRIQSNT